MENLNNNATIDNLTDINGPKVGDILRILFTFYGYLMSEIERIKNGEHGECLLIIRHQDVNSALIASNEYSSITDEASVPLGKTGFKLITKIDIHILVL